MRVLRAVKERLSGFGADAYGWTIITSAPKGEAGERWGDTWFARDVAAALRRQGQQVSVVPRSGANQPPRSHDDVVVVLRGLRGVDPPPKRTGVWILWVISHPELVTETEARAYDMVFVASKTWSPPGGVPSTPLLQATASDRFSPDAALPDSGAALLFVGSTRGQFRPAVRGALTSDRADELSVYGVGWEEFIEVDRISGEFLDNDQLPAAYAGAGIVLSDHHPEMAADGFLSNRLFDAVATGARVVSDSAAGLEDVFGDAVVVFTDEDDLVDILHTPVDDTFPSRDRRVEVAMAIAREHSFDARAGVLINSVRELKGAQ